MSVVLTPIERSTALSARPTLRSPIQTPAVGPRPHPRADVLGDPVQYGRRRSTIAKVAPSHMMANPANRDRSAARRISCSRRAGVAVFGRVLVARLPRAPVGTLREPRLVGGEVRRHATQGPGDGPARHEGGLGRSSEGGSTRPRDSRGRDRERRAPADRRDSAPTRHGGRSGLQGTTKHADLLRSLLVAVPDFHGASRLRGNWRSASGAG